MGKSKTGWIIGSLAAIGATAAGIWYYLKKKEDEIPVPPVPPVPPPVPPEMPQATIGAIRTYLRTGAGDVIVEADIHNTGDIHHTFNVGVSVGDRRQEWFDKDYFIDGLGDYAQVTLAPGQHQWVSRRMSIPPLTADAWVTVRDRDLNVLDQAMKAI